MTKGNKDKENNMRRFLQLHLLTSYPPSNLNRDDLGRPKTAVIGGSTRLRISSQSLKRAWRTSDIFREKFGAIEIHGQTGLRTKRIGRDIYEKLIADGIKEKDAAEWSRVIANQFGKIKSKDSIDTEIGKVKSSKLTDSEKKLKMDELEKSKFDIEQLSFISPEEQVAIFSLVDDLLKTKTEPTDEQLKLLKAENSAADVGLFGRMLASNPLHNIEAAVQVAHAFSVQKIQIEDDFFTAVDDLNRGEVDVGAGHMGDVEFASGVFYLYINIDRQLLENNLKGAGNESKELLENTIRAFVESAAIIAPTGKQNTFGSRARAHYVLAELGNQQPRSLSLAYLEPVKNEMSTQSVKRLKDLRDDMDRAYGSCTDESKEMDVIAKIGSLKEILDFCVKE